MAEPRTVTRRDIARITGLHIGTVTRRAMDEQWPHSARVRAGRGGHPVHVYRAADLPADVRARLRGEAPPPRPARSECSRPRCSRLAHAHGLCSGHWARKRDGRPLDEPPLEDMLPPPDRALVLRGIRRLQASVPSLAQWCRERGWDASDLHKIRCDALTGRKGRVRALALELERIGREGPDPGETPPPPSPASPIGEGELDRTPARLVGRCTVAACPEPHEAEGLCAGHLGRVRRGLPLGGPLERPPPRRRLSAPPRPARIRDRTAVPEGHPSRYRILKPARLPGWVKAL